MALEPIDTAISDGDGIGGGGGGDRGQQHRQAIITGDH